MNNIFVSEIFKSIQGEGRYIGYPAVFVRVGGCNLNCKFDGEKCDTNYAVDAKKYKNEWRLMNVDDIINHPIVAKNNKQNVLFVLTGGEPTLYYEQLTPLITKWKGKINIETNGTIFIDFKKYSKWKRCHFSISVKLSNSNQPKEKRIREDVLKNFKKNVLFDYKFVVGKDLVKEEEEIKEILQIAKPNGVIYCMPLAFDESDLKSKEKEVAEFCIKHNYCYSDRLHLRIFNGERGK